MRQSPASSSSPSSSSGFSASASTPSSSGSSSSATRKPSRKRYKGSPRSGTGSRRHRQSALAGRKVAARRTARAALTPARGRRHNGGPALRVPGDPITPHTLFPVDTVTLDMERIPSHFELRKYERGPAAAIISVLLFHLCSGVLYTMHTMLGFCCAHLPYVSFVCRPLVAHCPPAVSSS